MEKIFKNGVIYLIFAIICFLLSFWINVDKINIPYFKRMNKELSVDVIYKKNPPEVFFNGVKQPIMHIKENCHDLFINRKTNQDVRKIIIKNGEDIEKLMVFNGNQTIFLDKNTREIDINNSKTFLDKFSISFLSFFYNFKFYIFSIIFLFLFMVNFKGKVNHKVVFSGILLLGLILRLTELNAIPFWDDEIYTIVHTAKNAPLVYLFNDPGNPPLYYIYFKIYSSIFQNPVFYKLSSVFLGVIFNICFYFYIKQMLGKNKALIGMFIPTISILMIYFSQQLRSYALLMLLALLSSFFLLKFKKNKTIYAILSIALIYTHFYGVFLVLYNFIFGVLLFKRNKLKSFLFTNLAIVLAIIPLFIQKITSITSGFNSWIDPPLFGDFLDILENFCFAWIFLFIFLPLLFYAYKKSKKREKLILNYNFFAIVFLIIGSLVFSYTIKPIFIDRYFLVIQHCYFVLACYLVTFKLKNLVIKFAQLILFFLLTATLHLDCPNMYCNHNSFFDFVKNDIDNNKTNNLIVSDTIKGYDFGVRGVNMFYLPVNTGIEDVDLKEFQNKPNVVYVHNLYLTNEAEEKADYIEVYRSPLGIYTKVEYK